MDPAQNTHRFTDVVSSSPTGDGPLNPLYLDDIPLASFNDAMTPILDANLVPDLKNQIALCRFWVDEKLSENPKIFSPATKDEAIAIHIYTREGRTSEASFYYILNKLLRTTDRGLLKPFFSYLRLTFNGLMKLPSYEGSSTVWRGIQGDLAPAKGSLFWWGFSSCTSNMEVFNSVGFLGSAGPRVLFNIHVLYHSVDIQRFSACPTEHEVILLPGRYFEVKSTLNQGNLKIVELQERVPPYNVIEGLPIPQRSELDRPWKVFAELMRAKWAVIGPSGSGKSSLLRRWHGGGFHEGSPTIGIDISTKECASALGNIRIQIIDTGGQDRFKGDVQMHLSRATDVIIMCFPLVSRIDFQVVEQRWELARKCGNYSVVVVIGTMADLVQKREVTKQEALFYANSIGALYFEVSNKTNEGTDEAFKGILEALLKKAQFTKNDTVDLTQPIEEEQECTC